MAEMIQEMMKMMRLDKTEYFSNKKPPAEVMVIKDRITAGSKNGIPSNTPSNKSEKKR